MPNAAAIPAVGDFQRVFDQAAAADSSLGKESGVSGAKASPSGYGSADILTSKGSTYNPVMEQMLTQLAAAPRSLDPVVGVPGQLVISQGLAAPRNKPSSAGLPDGKARSQLTDLNQSATLPASPAAILVHGKSSQRATPSTSDSVPSTATSSDAVVNRQTAITSLSAVHNSKFLVNGVKHAEGKADLDTGAAPPTSEQSLGLNSSPIDTATTASPVPISLGSGQAVASVPILDELPQPKSFLGHSGQARQTIEKLDFYASQPAEVVDGSSRGINQQAIALVEANSAPSHPHATHSGDLQQSDLQSTKADTIGVSGLPGARHPVERARPLSLLSPTSVDPGASEATVPPASPPALPAGGGIVAIKPADAILSINPVQSAAPQIAPALITLATRTDGSNEMTVSLHPLDLGKVEVRLTRGRDGSTAVTISATEPKTLQELSQNVHHLHAALDAANVPVEGRIINFMVANSTASDQSQSDLPGHNGAPAMNLGSNASGGQNGSQSQPWQQDQRRQAVGSSSDEDTVHGEAASSISIRNWQFSGLNITA